MKFKAGDEVRVTADRGAFGVKNVRGRVYSVNSHVTAPYPYGVKLYVWGRVEYRAFAEDELRAWTSEAAPISSPTEHPTHYTWLPNGVEVIDLTEHLNFNRGNAVKYLCRAGRKEAGTELEDLKKARWYINREISRTENQASPTPGEKIKD
ncbi:DUF3310 domain-containing protein [Streptomyces sp. NPDC051546]|uniref:DUF3310 domain-containing protein n=1 Tax=Streptomyces sp. NPDC051546 TaxID=3365655 RepID=UPI003798E273